MREQVQFVINNQEVEVFVEPSLTLLDLVREELELTGARRGCETNFCGNCTMLLDGKAVHSCCVLSTQVRGKKVTTIEGLAQGEVLHPVQDAFIEEDAFQCGYCTPAMILSVKALLDELPNPSDAEARDALEGVLCRCGTYPRILQVVKSLSSS